MNVTHDNPKSQRGLAHTSLDLDRIRKTKLGKRASSGVQIREEVFLLVGVDRLERGVTELSL